MSSIIAAVKNKAIADKCRDNITPELVDAVILKEKKTMQEMIDTCPTSRTDLLAEYNKKMSIIEEFSPKLMESFSEIESYIKSLGIEIIPKNRGSIMKELKGKANMKVANDVLKNLL